MNECPHCKKAMSDWLWVRFAGLGAWEGKNENWTCPECELKFDGTKVKEIKIKETNKAPHVTMEEPYGTKYY